MSEEIVKGVVAHGAAILDAWDATLDDLASIRGPNDEKFDLDKVIPGLNPAESVNSLGRQLRAAVEISTSLSDLDTLTGVPRTHVGKWSSHIGELRTHIDAYKVAVGTFRSKGSITLLDSNNLTAQNSANESLALPSLLQKLNELIDPVSNFAQLIRVFTASNAEIGQSIDLISSAREKQAKVLGDITAGLKKLETAKGKAAASVKAAAESATNANTFEEEGKKAKDTAVTASTEAQTALKEIQVVNDSATQLKTTVDSYKTAFDDFQANLDSRNLSFKEGEEEKTNSLPNYGSRSKRRAECKKKQEPSWVRRLWLVYQGTILRRLRVSVTVCFGHKLVW